MTALLKPAFGWLSPAGPRARLSTLIFHRVLPEPDPLFPHEICAQRFDAICGWVARWFNVLPLDAAAAQLQQGRLPARALAITFDDGYADNHDVALPILQRHGLQATFFIATGFLDGGRMWNDTLIEAIRRSRQPRLALDGLGLDGLPDNLPLATLTDRQAAIDRLLGPVKYLPHARRLAVVQALTQRLQAVLPDDLMMRSDQVRALHAAGMQIGAHTVSHPLLGGLDDAQARAEVHGSKQALETLLGDRVGLFAYPNGKPGTDYSDASVRVVAGAGFDAAVSTSWGHATTASDRFQLPRFTPWDRSPGRFGLRMLQNLRR